MKPIVAFIILYYEKGFILDNNGLIDNCPQLAFLCLFVYHGLSICWSFLSSFLLLHHFFVVVSIIGYVEGVGAHGPDSHLLLLGALHYTFVAGVKEEY